MTQALHSRARTTHLIREEIKNSTLSQAELVRLYNVSRQTIRKWQDRDSVDDVSHRPKTMYTTLTPDQELIVVELRRTLLLPTDDLLSITREFINPAVSRAGLGRCLRRHGMSDLRDLVRELLAGTATKKTFKDYEPGFLHIDNGVPQRGRRYLDLYCHLRCMLLSTYLARVDALVGLRLVARGLRLPYHPRPDVANGDADGFAFQASFEDVRARAGSGQK